MCIAFYLDWVWTVGNPFCSYSIIEIKKSIDTKLTSHLQEFPTFHAIILLIFANLNSHFSTENSPFTKNLFWSNIFLYNRFPTFPFSFFILADIQSVMSLKMMIKKAGNKSIPYLFILFLFNKSLHLDSNFT